MQIDSPAVRERCREVDREAKASRERAAMIRLWSRERLEALFDQAIGLPPSGSSPAQHDVVAHELLIARAEKRAFRLSRRHPN
jgi:hypothetical protein